MRQRRAAKGSYIYVYNILYIFIFIHISITGGGDQRLYPPSPPYLPFVRLTPFCTLRKVKHISHLSRGLHLHFLRGYINCDIIDDIMISKPRFYPAPSALEKIELCNSAVSCFFLPHTTSKYVFAVECAQKYKR